MSEITTIFFQGLLQLLTRTADALLANFADILVSGFVGFACFIALFRKLNHDELTVSAVLSVELYDSVGGGGRAGKEIHNNIISRRGILHKCFQKCSGLRIVENATLEKRR